MSKHLFGAVVTPHGIAANNRGENEGNLTTLQKVLWNGDVHTTVSAEAIRWAVRDDTPAEGARRGTRARGSTLVRRSRFEATRAVSLSPWTGDVVFNVASPGATPSASRRAGDPVPYGGEVHATRYQYAFALTPES